MPTERQVLRSSSRRRLKSSHEEQDSEPPAARPPSSPPEPSNPTPLNDLIRALETSPPKDELPVPDISISADIDVSDGKAADKAKVPAKSSGLNPLPRGKLQKRAGDTSRSITKPKAKGNGGRNAKSQVSAAKKRPTVSDEDSSRMRKKKAKKSAKSSKEKLQATKINNADLVTMEDCINIIDNAVSEQRIDEKKAQRLNECLQSGNWPEVAFNLLCEQIPMKRRGKGYTCRVCQVPKKGHTCMYCHVCSTPDTKFKKDDEHVCINCPTCFEVGKKNKKLIQIKCEGHTCPHGPLAAEPTETVPV